MRVSIVGDARALHAMKTRPAGGPPRGSPGVRSTFGGLGSASASGRVAGRGRVLRGDALETILKENRKFMSADALRFVEGPPSPPKRGR